MRRRDSSNDQLREACKGDGRAASLLAFLIGMYEYKLKRKYESMLIDYSRAELASKLFCSESTIKRASETLVALGYITICRQPSGFDRRLLYDLNYEKVKCLYQDMPLFGTLNAHVVKVTTSYKSGCPHRTGQGDQNISSSIPSHEPITIIKAEDGDDGRKELISEMRDLGVVTEQAELWMTKYTRPLIQTGIEYVRGRMGKERIDNPGGLLNSFLQNPGLRGYEMDIQGQWHRVGSKPKPSQYKPPPVDPEWKARYEENRKREASAARERRLYAEVVPVGE